MRRFAFAFAAFSLALGAHAQSLRSQIETMNKKIDAIMMKRDYPAFVKVVKPGVTKDFKYTEQGKTSDFDTMLKGVKMGFAGMKSMKYCTSKIVSFAEKGDTAVCTTSHTMVGTTAGEHGKTAPFNFKGTSVETYKKVGGKWLMSSMAWKN